MVDSERSKLLPCETIVQSHSKKKKLALKGNKFYGIKMCSQYSLEKTKM